MKKLISMLLAVIMMGVLFPSQASATVSGTNQIKISGIPVVSQLPNLPTGCEATGLTMLLNFFGTSLTKEQVASMQPEGPNIHRINGILYGADPTKEFIGSPYDSHSFGIYHQPFLPLIESYFPGRSENLSGGAAADLYRTIDSGRPVLVWASVNMMPVTPGISWMLEDGTVFQWKNGNHALLLVGYTDSQVIVNDPWTGREEYYNKAIFEERWTAMGKQAITVKAVNPKTPSFYYDDVFEEDWYFSVIERMTEMGIVSGYGDRTFRPKNDCTYGEFIKLARQIMVEKIVAENPDKELDLAAEQTISKKIIAEVSKYKDISTEAYLTSPIIRKEMVQILYGLLNEEEITTDSMERIAFIYEDVSELNEGELAAFTFVEQEGIVSGNNNEMSPEDCLTRTEVLIIRERTTEEFIDTL